MYDLHRVSTIMHCSSAGRMKGNFDGTYFLTTKRKNQQKKKQKLKRISRHLHFTSIYFKYFSSKNQIKNARFFQFIQFVYENCGVFGFIVIFDTYFIGHCFNSIDFLQHQTMHIVHLFDAGDERIIISMPHSADKFHIFVFRYLVECYCQQLVYQIHGLRSY